MTPTEDVQNFLEAKRMKKLQDGITAYDFLKRTEISYDDIEALIGAPADKELDRREKEQVEITIKYEGYIKKEKAKIAKLHKLEAKEIPENLDYDDVDNLATEAREKLKRVGPQTIAQASRISGVNPADIGILTVYIQRGKIKKTV